jgi:AraC-like DNA-binding protein
MPTILYFTPHGALSFVSEQDSQDHAHRALQLSVALVGGLQVQTDGHWRRHEFLWLAPNAPHRIKSAGALTANLFLDPGPRAFAAWRAAGGEPVAPDRELRGRLYALAVAERDPATAAALLGDWLAHSLPGLAALPAQPDPRIQRALQFLEGAPDDCNHRRLAEISHLSISRFAERFRAETGMAVRNYLLWRRLLRAVEALQAGASVTEAAMDGGFSDTAHLSRSFRRTFGAAPTDLA